MNGVANAGPGGTDMRIAKGDALLLLLLAVVGSTTFSLFPVMFCWPLVALLLLLYSVGEQKFLSPYMPLNFGLYNFFSSCV